MNSILFPALLAVCSIVSAIISRTPVAYFNLFLAIVLLCLVLFAPDKSGQSRLKLSALWLLLSELAALVLMLFGVDIYRSSLVWLMYAVFILLEIFVSPRIAG